MLAFAEIDSTFDARFSCIFREYNYFFFARNMDVGKIAKAGSKFIGLHDFRNFCKPDNSVFRPDDEE
jgi:tRNA pseudouridine38/39 synthase